MENCRGATIIQHHWLNVEAWECYRGGTADPRVMDYVYMGSQLVMRTVSYQRPATENHKAATQHATRKTQNMEGI